MRRQLCIVSIFLMLWVKTQAQPKALGLPLPYIRPIDYSATADLYKKYIEDKHRKSNNNGWIVFSDRNNNSISEKPNGRVVREIEIDRFFYVVQEKDEYIKIAEAKGIESNLSLSGFKKELGWVKKDNMLLWTSSLVNSEIKTPKKIILINKEINAIAGAQYDEENKIQVYDGPNSYKKLLAIPAFSICYVLKKDIQNHRLLISYSRNISTLNISQMIGWVDENRCLEWDNGLAIEANDNETAFRERIDSSEKRLKVFNSEIYANQNNEIGVIFRQDPVSDFLDNVAHSNKRYRGTTFRLPLLGVTSQNNLKTGVFIPTILDRYPERGNIKVYNDGFVPLYYPNTNHKLVQFVFLFNETDLLEYQKILKSGLISSMSYDEKRKALYETYQNFIFHYAGEGKFKGKKIRNWTYQEIIKMITGGFENVILSENNIDFELYELFDSNKKNNEAIDLLLLRLKKANDNIDNLIKNNSEFTFKNPNGELSYWLKVEDIIF